MRKRFLASFLLLIVAATTYASDLITKVIPLHYRQAEELVTLIQPMMSDSVRFSGKNYTLIVKASPAELTKIRYLLTKLDVKPASLRISVRRGGGQSVQTKGLINMYETRSRDSGVQTIRMLEGRGAYINNGKQIPFVRLVQGPFWGRVVQDYKKLPSGFWVLPQVRGSTVLLTIIAKSSSLRPNDRIELQKISTQIRVPLGQWVSLAEGSRMAKVRRRRIIYQTTGAELRDQTLWVKVDKLL